MIVSSAVNRFRKAEDENFGTLSAKSFFFSLGLKSFTLFKSAFC